MPRLARLPIHAKIREERAKLLAAGCQNAAIALAVSVLVAPAINPALSVEPSVIVAMGAIVCTLELAALSVLRYIVRKELRHDRS